MIGPSFMRQIYIYTLAQTHTRTFVLTDSSIYNALRLELRCLV